MAPGKPIRVKETSTLDINEVSREVLNPHTSSESLILEIQWTNEVRMNISLPRTYYWDTWPPTCGYEGVLPFDPESHVQVWGCGSICI